MCKANTIPKCMIFENGNKLEAIKLPHLSSAGNKMANEIGR